MLRKAYQRLSRVVVEGTYLYLEAMEVGDFYKVRSTCAYLGGEKNRGLSRLISHEKKI